MSEVQILYIYFAIASLYIYSHHDKFSYLKSVKDWDSASQSQTQTPAEGLSTVQQKSGFMRTPSCNLD